MKLFLEQFAKHVSSQPNKTCLADGHGTLTYREVDEVTNHLAQSLVAKGLAPGQSVGVFVSSQKEIMVGAIAILKAGGVYLPLDEQYPNERIAFMLKDANARFILLDRELAELRNCKFESQTTIYFNDFRMLQSLKSVPRSADDRAMILYTSGTTGKPKGVIHRHALLASVNDWVSNHDDLAFDKSSTMGIMSGFTFVATNVFMFGVLLAGGTLDIAPKSVKFGTDHLFDYIKKQSITHIFMPSSLATTMIEDYDLSGVSIFAGGEKLRNFKPLSKGAKLYNFYGSTETATIFSTRVYGNESPVPVGYLTKNTRAILVDENLKAVKDGEVGELLVSDERMSQGYLNLDDVVAEKWIDIDGRLFFRTGDRMKNDGQGCFCIIGRTDNMVKLRGFRIETGEVEVQIAKAFSRLGLGDSDIVVGLRTVNGNDHLCCWYESDIIIESQRVKESVAEHLPDYMIPDLWENVEEMPRNFNGKVIRTDLPTPKLTIQLLGAIDSEVELRIAETVGTILKIEGAIDTEESFVSLGGDSLSAMELSSALSMQGISVGATQVLAASSLHEIAKNAKVKYERLWSIEEFEAVQKRFGERGENVLEVLPLTPEQDDLICFNLTHPDAPLLEKNYLFSLNSKISKDILQGILSEMATRHSSMRAAVAYRNLSVFQGVITDRTVPCKVIDSKKTDLADLKDSVLSEADTQYCDLESTPTFRVLAINLANGNSLLFIQVNKLAYNLNLLRVLFSELMAGLANHYPNDQEICSWSELFNDAIKIDKKNDPKPYNGQRIDTNIGEKRAEICTYSEKGDKKIFFVHTGNTGAEAYYQLAQRIKDDFSFFVLEPYNLYHPDDIKNGINEIASKYIQIMKHYQGEGPYILGGWCYGGVVAHEMACQLQMAGEEVERLIMLDSHCLDDERSRKLAAPMQESTDRRYFETCPLFKELREKGMLEAVIENSERVVSDLNTHIPKRFDGHVTYFKPSSCPEQASGDVLEYWNEMMKLKAGNYEKYCNPEKLEVIVVPGEHDTMMNKESLDIIVPKLKELLQERLL